MSSLEPLADINADLTRRLDSLRTLVVRLQPSTSAARQSVAEIEAEIRGLANALKSAIDEKTGKIRKLEQVVASLGEDLDEARRQHILMNAAPQAPKARAPTHEKSSNSGMVASGMLRRFIAQQQMPAAARPESARSAVVLNRFQQVVSGTGGPMAARNAPVIRSVDLVSASIYSVLEAVTVRCRADIGLIWLRLPDSGECVAPFLVGRQSRATVPYHSPASSIPTVVAATGIAANVRPSKQPHHESHTSLSSLIEDNKRATLCAPIYTRYGEHSRTTLGALQLLAAEDSSFGFSEVDERFVFTAVVMLSSMISGHYGAMSGEWTTRMYDPSPLARDVTYCAELDQRSSSKEVDDFPSLPMLVYRGNHPEPNTSPRTLVQANALKSEITRNAVPSTPAECMRDVNRYTRSIEQNWSAAVNTQAGLERKLEALGVQLEAARQGMGSSTRETNRTATFAPLDAMRRSTLTAVEVEDLHDATIARMRATKGTTFLTDQGLVTPKKPCA
jgi:hypothetical protein